MTTILASPAWRPYGVGSRSTPDVEAAPQARRAPRTALAEQDALDWLIGACADHLATRRQSSRTALAAHLLAGAGYDIAEGLDAQAHNMRVELATGIAARLLERDHAERGR
jgi:hypothetical protein